MTLLEEHFEELLTMYFNFGLTLADLALNGPNPATHLPTISYLCG